MNDNEEIGYLKSEKIKPTNNENNKTLFNNNDEKKNIITSISNNKIRDDIWDNYKGILIFLVVFGHFLYHYYLKFPKSLMNKIVIFIYSFHMPAFVFCSGYFSKSNNSKSKKSISKFIIQYIVFDSFLMLYYYYINNDYPNIFLPKLSYWYLLSLSFWRMIIPFLENENFLIFKSFFFALIIGYSPNCSTNNLSFRRTFAFFPFFVLGYYFKDEDFKKIMNFIQKIKIIVILFLFLFSYILFYLLIKHKISFTENSLLMFKYRYNKEIIKRIQLFIIALIMSFLLLFSLPNKKIPIITMIGRNSLYIYLFHIVFTLLFRRYFGLKINLNKLILYSFILTIIITLVFGNNYFNTKMNQFFDYIYINISLNNKKGKFIKFLFILFFSLLILIRPIDKIYFKPKTKKKNEMPKII